MSISELVSNPTGGAVSRRPDRGPSLNIDLLERVVDPENIELAWRKVKANNGAGGVDGMTIVKFPAFKALEWPEIRRKILAGNYQPSPVLRVSIAKPGGRGERLLGIPCILDRVIQQAILQVLSPIFNPGFSESSYGFRPHCSAHGAIESLKEYLKENNVQHDKLMERISRKVGDKDLLRLIRSYLRAGVMISGCVYPTEIGTVQGGPLSPLLANILLDDLDKELEKRGHCFARYADDLIILVKSKRAGERVKASVTRFLTGKLHLKVNEQKSAVLATNDCIFLGFTFRGSKVRWSEKAFQSFKYRVRKLTSRSWGVSMKRRIKELNQYLRGWMNYFGISEYYGPIPELDGWIRRRLRMCYWKQWKRPKTRIRNLLKLGTNKKQAILTGLSSKSYWHLSRTLATQHGMTNKWFDDQGLLLVKQLWINVRFGTKNRPVRTRTQGGVAR